jgi:hypothetical protein
MSDTPPSLIHLRIWYLHAIELDLKFGTQQILNKCLGQIRLFRIIV